MYFAQGSGNESIEMRGEETTVINLTELVMKPTTTTTQIPQCDRKSYQFLRIPSAACARNVKKFAKSH